MYVNLHTVNISSGLPWKLISYTFLVLPQHQRSFPMPFPRMPVVVIWRTENSRLLSSQCRERRQKGEKRRRRCYHTSQKLRTHQHLLSLLTSEGLSAVIVPGGSRCWSIPSKGWDSGNESCTKVNVYFTAGNFNMLCVHRGLHKPVKSDKAI